MHTGEKIIVGIKLLLPLLLAVLLGLMPQPRAAGAALAMAQAAEARSQPYAAADQLQQALSILPWRGDLWERLGEQRLSSRQYALAAQAYQKAWLLGNISNHGLEQLAEAHLGLQEDAGAALAWQALIQRGGASGEVYARLAAARRRMGDLLGAVDVLREWQAAFPQDGRAAFALGTHLLLAAPEDAGEVLGQAAELQPAYAKTVAALQAVQQAVLNEPDETYRLMILGRALGQAGEWELAGLAFVQVTEQEPEYADAWAMLGEARQQQGLDGREALEKAQSLAPDSVLVRSLWALYWRRQAKPEVALVLYAKLAAQEPQQAVWQAEMGNALSEMGDILSALPYYQQAALLAGDDPLYWQMLARFSIDHGIDARSVGLPAARKVLFLRPDDPSALDLMGWTMLYLQDYPSAERFLQQAIQLEAAYAPAHLHLGQLYLQTGQYRKARIHLLQAVSLDQQGITGNMAQRLLDSLY